MLTIFEFIIQSLKHAGIVRTGAIVWEKLNRSMRARRIDSAIASPSLEAFASVPFKRILPISQDRISSYIDMFPALPSQIEALIEVYCTHRFSFLGQRWPEMDAVNWHLDPGTMTEWPRRTYVETAIYANDTPPDVKPIWELNRHQYFFFLALAYQIGGNKKYLNELQSQWISWIDNNAFCAGINWASPLEIAIRLISWIVTLHLIESSLTESQRHAITKSIWQQTSFLAAHLSTDKIVRTNHLIGEATGLLCTAATFGFSESQSWFTKAHLVLETEIQNQIHDDGVSKEQSLSYHRFTADFFLLAWIIGARTSESFSEKYSDRLVKMIEYLAEVRTPYGLLPPIGDFDNARGFQLLPGVDAWNPRMLITVSRQLIQKDPVRQVECLDEESFWLVDKFQAPAQTGSYQVPIEKHIAIFANSGHIVLRDNKNGYCFIRCGEFGMGGSGYSSHSHADLFSPVLTIDGHPILVDTGTWTYSRQTTDRDMLRSPMAHNVTVVANHPLPKPKPWFGWQTVLNGKIFSVKEEMNFVTIECGYEKQSLYPYRRLIKYDTALSVFEFVEQCRSVDKDAETYFLLHPDLKINPRPNAIDLLSENRPIARLLYDQLCTMRTKQGRTTMQYGLFRETTMLVFEWKTSPVSTVAFKIGLYDSLSEKA